MLKWYRDHQATVLFGVGVTQDLIQLLSTQELKSSGRDFLSGRSLPILTAEPTSLPGELCPHRQWSLCMSLSVCTYPQPPLGDDQFSLRKSCIFIIQDKVHCNALVHPTPGSERERVDQSTRHANYQLIILLYLSANLCFNVHSFCPWNVFYNPIT